jgi:hypothetical protein
MQYDISEKVLVGGMVKTPGIHMSHRGSAGMDATPNKNGVMTNLSYYDGSPTMDLKVPFEFAGGFAYKTGKGTFEVDFRVIQGNGVYTFFSPNTNMTGIIDAGGSSVPQGFETPFRSYKIDSRSVVDVRVGGRYELSERGKLTFHGGVATNNSPVGEGDEVFQKANLLRFTAGLTGEKGRFIFAGGLDYQGGTTPLYSVYTAQSGVAVKTTVKAVGFGLVYSFGLRF